MRISVATGGSAAVIMILVSLSYGRLTPLFLTRYSRHTVAPSNFLPEYPTYSEPSFDDDFRLDDEDPVDDFDLEEELSRLPHRRNASRSVSRLRRTKGQRRCGKELVFYAQQVCGNCIKGSKLPKVPSAVSDDYSDDFGLRRKRSPAVRDSITKTCCQQGCTDEELMKFCCN